MIVRYSKTQHTYIEPGIILLGCSRPLDFKILDTVRSFVELYSKAVPGAKAKKHNWPLDTSELRCLEHNRYWANLEVQSAWTNPDKRGLLFILTSELPFLFHLAIKIQNTLVARCFRNGPGLMQLDRQLRHSKPIHWFDYELEQEPKIQKEQKLRKLGLNMLHAKNERAKICIQRLPLGLYEVSEV